MRNEGAEFWNPISDRLTIPMRRTKMEKIDRKFKFTAVSEKSGKKYTQNNAVVFLAKDAFLPELLDEYYKICLRNGVDMRQLEGIGLLKVRITKYQNTHEKLVKFPDVEQGKEEKRVCKPNKE